MPPAVSGSGREAAGSSLSKPLCPPWAECTQDACKARDPKWSWVFTDGLFDIKKKKMVCNNGIVVMLLKLELVSFRDTYTCRIRAGGSGWRYRWNEISHMLVIIKARWSKAGGTGTVIEVQWKHRTQPTSWHSLGEAGSKPPPSSNRTATLPYWACAPEPSRQTEHVCQSLHDNSLWVF